MKRFIPFTKPNSMSQKIETIDIQDLVLWTENPRDPIRKNAKDQDIVNAAWLDKNEKWNLKKLAREMQHHYDFSELPTVVFHGNKPVVYDGNRRMILAKIAHDCVTLAEKDSLSLPEIPAKIPCNVCSKEIAIQNVFRKHGDSGSWSPLDRDLFINKFKKEPKSTFLKFDEATGIISNNPHLNKVFVKEEVFSDDKLAELGFEFDGDELASKHSIKESRSILKDISEKVALKTISTRNNRGKVVSVLEKSNRDIVAANNSKPSKTLKLKITGDSKDLKKRQTRRTKKKNPEIFGGPLYLKKCAVSDLHRDICDLHKFYIDNKSSLSPTFPALVRMALRLLCETASTDLGIKMDDFLTKNFKAAKKNLSKDTSTTIFAQNVKEGTIVPLLHVGAHNYAAAKNHDQTLAVSFMVGEILSITHGK